MLQTERLVLRPLAVTDLETTHTYASDPENTQYMIYLPNQNKEETAQFLQRASSEWLKDEPSFYEFAITLDGAHIGAASIHIDEECELGWILHKAYHGHGYATEAAKVVLDFAVQTRGAKRVIAHCDQENIASQRVMEKLGMTLAHSNGIRRNRASNVDSFECKYALDIPTTPM